MSLGEHLDRYGEHPDVEGDTSHQDTHWCDCCGRWPAKVDCGPGCQLCSVCAEQAVGIEEAGGSCYEVLG